jgi:hypothetical protein
MGSVRVGAHPRSRTRDHLRMEDTGRRSRLELVPRHPLVFPAKFGLLGLPSLRSRSRSTVIREPPSTSRGSRHRPARPDRLPRGRTGHHAARLAVPRQGLQLRPPPCPRARAAGGESETPHAAPTAGPPDVRVALFDWAHGGHHRVYLRRFADALARDTDVVVPASGAARLSPRPTTAQSSKGSDRARLRVETRRGRAVIVAPIVRRIVRRRSTRSSR